MEKTSYILSACHFTSGSLSCNASNAVRKQSFSQPLWLARHHVEDRYVAMLPRGQTEITAEEAAAVERVFSKEGELPAEQVELTIRLLSCSHAAAQCNPAAALRGK